MLTYFRSKVSVLKTSTWVLHLSVTRLKEMTSGAVFGISRCISMRGVAARNDPSTRLKLVVESWENPKPIFREERLPFLSVGAQRLWCRLIKGFKSKVWCFIITMRFASYHIHCLQQKSTSKVNENWQRCFTAFITALWLAFQRHIIPSSSHENEKRLWNAPRESY